MKTNKMKKPVSESESLEYVEDEEKSLNFEKKNKKLKEKLKFCQKEKMEYLSGWQKERADFINYKKGEGERAEEIKTFQKTEIILEILSILDNIERAENGLPKDLLDNQWVRGMLEIGNGIKNILKREGVEEIDAKGKFNPEFCEAVKVVEGEDDKIIEVLQKGYLLSGRVLRPARVKVGQKKVKINPK